MFGTIQMNCNIIIIVIIGNLRYIGCGIIKSDIMKLKIVPNFFAIVFALILGGAIYQQFDFQEMRFEKTVLSIIYVITFIASILMMIKRKKSAE